MYLPGCRLAKRIHTEDPEILRHPSEFDVNAAPHPVVNDCINYKACLFGCSIISFVQTQACADKRQAVDRCDLVQGLWMTWGMHCVTLYLASISSPPVLLLHMVWFQCVYACVHMNMCKSGCVCRCVCVCMHLNKEWDISHHPLKFLHSLLQCSLISPTTLHAL